MNDQQKVSMFLKNLRSAAEDLIALSDGFEGNTTDTVENRLIAFGNTLERAQHSLDSLTKAVKE